MKKTSLKIGLVATVLSLVVPLAACSSQGSGDGQSSQGADATASAAVRAQDITAPIVAGVTADPALTANLPDGFKTNINVGSNLQSPPATFLAEDSKTPIGFEIDVINAIANRLGTNLTISNMQFDTLITGLQGGRVDLIIASMNDNASRQQAIDFVDYFNSGIAIMVQKGNPLGINGPADLCGQPVSAAPGSSQLAWAERVSPTLCEGKSGPIEVIVNDSDQQRLNDLKTGRSAAALNDMPNVSYIVQISGDGNDFEMVKTDLIEGAPYGIGFNKESTQLRDSIQEALQSLIDDGTYAQILEAWGVESGAITTATVNGGK